MSATSPKTAIITGAGDSVGRVTLEKFVSQGIRVACLELQPDRLDKIQSEFPGIVGVCGNAGDVDTMQELFDQAISAFERVDILINTVGIAGPTAGLEDVSVSDWETVFDVNVRGVFLAMKLAVPHMKAAGGGAIINYSSASTKTGLPLRTPYIASKAAIEGLTHTAARELGPYGIRCNAILPGIIDNDRMRGIIAKKADLKGIDYADMEASYLEYVSMQTMIDPSELADLTVYLTSDAARHLTGQLIEYSGLLEWEA